MKILLVNVQKETPYYVTDYEPLGLAYLSAYAKQSIPDLEINILNSADPSKIFSGNYDLIGFSSVSQSFGYTLELVRHAQDLKIPILIGGVHITLLPKSLPQGGVVGVIGEGEHTFVELITLLRDKGRFSDVDLSHIKGIAYYDKSNNLCVTAPRPPIDPLDLLPLPDRELLNIRKNGTVYLFSSRGCPFKCAFCASTRLFDRLRLFSADYVVNEIRHIIRKYNPDHIKFYDDLFIASKKRLRNIVEMLNELAIPKKVLFSLNATASMIDDETAKLLRKMNVYSIGMGLESGNQHILDYLKAGKATVEQNEKAVNILVDNGINPTASFIIGSPSEDEACFNDTLNFINRSKLSRSYLYLLTPYPGTPVWEYAVEKGFVSSDMNWDLLDINENTEFEKRIILSENFSPEMLRKLFNKFQSISRKKYFQRMIVQGLKRPDLIYPFLKFHLKKLINNG